MRDIKFRSYNPRDKKMHYDITGIEIVNDGSISGIFIDGAFFLIEEVYLMQYTGLKDKNGKEIYEGDIVSLQFDLSSEISKVVWLQDISGYIVENISILNKDLAEKIIVIGNIYDNPDLLEKEGKEDE